MTRNTWKDYFTFSKKERVAVIILLVIIVALVVVPFLVPDKQTLVEDEDLKQQLAQLESPSTTKEAVPYRPQSQGENQGSTANPPHFTLFNFDPNTLDEAGFQRLGLREKTIRTIINYRSKGGRFRQAEDIRKIYGLHEDEATQLIPYIRIKDNAATDKPTERYVVYDAKKYPAIDINKATTDDWKTLPGIDDAISNRIIKFRTILHGFTSIDQVKQTNGLPDSVYQHIRPYLKLGK